MHHMTVTCPLGSHNEFPLIVSRRLVGIFYLNLCSLHGSCLPSQFKQRKLFTNFLYFETRLMQEPTAEISDT